MEEIEYLEEYEDLVLSKAINSAAVASKVPQQTETDEGSSSSLDQDIFNCLFDDNSDDDNDEQQTTKNEETNLNCKRTSRASGDSIDLLTDLGEQVAREFELKKDITDQQTQRSCSSIKNTPKSQPKATSTLRLKTYSVKNSEGKISLLNNYRVSQSVAKTKSVATVRPTVQNKGPLKKPSTSRESSLGHIHKQTPLVSLSSSKTSTSNILHTIRTSKTLQTGTSNLPSSSNLKKTSTNQPLKTVFVKQRAATIVKPEKIISKDPPEDPLNLDDLSSTESANYSVSDISGETYNSISDFDDDDYDFTSHIENLDEEDDDSSNSQIIDISNDSSGSRSQFEDLRTTTPSPVVSEDHDLSSNTDLEKQHRSSPKYMANHDIIKSLLSKGEKPKLLQLITEYDTTDKMDTKTSKSATSTEPIKRTHDHATAASPPNELSKEKVKELTITEVQEDFSNTCVNTMDCPNTSRGGQSPGTMSHDSYLSVVNEMLEESYAEAMKSSKLDVLSNQEVGAEMEIGVDETTDVVMYRAEDTNSEIQVGRRETESCSEKQSYTDEGEIEILAENSVHVSSKSIDEEHSSEKEDVKNVVQNKIEEKLTFKCPQDSIQLKNNSTETSVESAFESSNKNQFGNDAKSEAIDVREELDDENGFQGFHEETLQNLPSTNITKSALKEKVIGSVEHIERKSTMEHKINCNDEQGASISKVNTKKYSATTFKSPSKETDQSNRSRERSLDRAKEILSKHDGPKMAIRNPFVQRTVHKNVKEVGSRKSVKDRPYEKSVTDRSREKSKDRFVVECSATKKEPREPIHSSRELLKTKDGKQYKSSEEDEKAKHSNILTDKGLKRETKSNECRSKDLPSSSIKKKDSTNKISLDNKPPKTHVIKNLNIPEDSKKMSGSKEISKECKLLSSTTKESNKKSIVTSEANTSNIIDEQHKDSKKSTKKSFDSTEKSGKDKLTKATLDKTPIISSTSLGDGANKQFLNQTEKSVDVLKTAYPSKETTKIGNVTTDSPNKFKSSLHKSNELKVSSKKLKVSDQDTKCFNLESSTSSASEHSQSSKTNLKIDKSLSKASPPRALKQSRSGGITPIPTPKSNKKNEIKELKRTVQNPENGNQSGKLESNISEEDIQSTAYVGVENTISNKLNTQEEFNSTLKASETKAGLKSVFSKEDKKTGDTNIKISRRPNETKADGSVTPQQSDIKDVATSNDIDVGADNAERKSSDILKNQITKTTKNVNAANEIQKSTQGCGNTEHEEFGDNIDYRKCQKYEDETLNKMDRKNSEEKSTGKKVEAEQVDSAKRVHKKDQEVEGGNSKQIDMEKEKLQISKNDSKANKGLFECIGGKSTESKSKEKENFSRKAEVETESKNENMKDKTTEAMNMNAVIETDKNEVSEKLTDDQVAAESNKDYSETIKRLSNNPTSGQVLDAKSDISTTIGSNNEGKAEDNYSIEEHKLEMSNTGRKTRNTRSVESINAVSCNTKCFADESPEAESGRSLSNIKDLEDSNEDKVKNRKTRIAKIDESDEFAIDHKKETNEYKKESRVVTIQKKVNTKVATQKCTSSPQANVKETKKISTEKNKTEEILTEDSDKNQKFNSDIKQEVKQVTTPQKNTRKTRNACVPDDVADNAKNMTQSKCLKDEDILSKTIQRNCRKTRNTPCGNDDVEKEIGKVEGLEGKCAEENVTTKILPKISGTTRTVTDPSVDDKVELHCHDTKWDYQTVSSSAKAEDVTLVKYSNVAERDFCGSSLVTDHQTGNKSNLIDENKTTNPLQEDSEKGNYTLETVENKLKDNDTTLKHQDTVLSGDLNSVQKKTRTLEMYNCSTSNDGSSSKETKNKHTPNSFRTELGFGDPSPQVLACNLPQTSVLSQNLKKVESPSKGETVSDENKSKIFPPKDHLSESCEFSINKNEPPLVLCGPSRIVNDSTISTQKDTSNRARTLRKRGTESPFPLNVTNKEPFKQPPSVLNIKQTSPISNQGASMKRRLRSPAADNAKQFSTTKRPKTEINRKSRSQCIYGDGTDIVNPMSKSEKEVHQNISDAGKPLDAPLSEYALHKSVESADEVVFNKSMCESMSEIETSVAKCVEELVGVPGEDSSTISSANKSVTYELNKDKIVQKPSYSPKSISPNLKVSHIVKNKVKLYSDKKISKVGSPEKSSSCSVLSFAEWLKNNNRTEATHEDQQSELKQNLEDNRRHQNHLTDSSFTLGNTKTKMHNELPSETNLKDRAPITRVISKVLSTSTANPSNDCVEKTTTTETLSPVAQNLCNIKNYADDNVGQSPKSLRCPKSNDRSGGYGYTTDSNGNSLSQLSSSTSAISPAQPKMTRRRRRRRGRLIARKIMSKPTRRASQKNIVDRRSQSLSPTKHEKSKTKRSETDILIESMSKEMKDGGIQDLLNSSNHVKRPRISSKRNMQVESALSISTEATVNIRSDVSPGEKVFNDTSKIIESANVTKKLSTIPIPHKLAIRRPQPQERTKKSPMSKELTKETSNKEVLPIEVEKALIDEIELINMNPLKSNDKQISSNAKSGTFKTPKPLETPVSSPLTLTSTLQKHISRKSDSRNDQPFNISSKQSPPLKCRSLKVRLNRSFVKKYLQHLNNANIAMTVCVKEAERNSIRNFRKAPRSSTQTTPPYTSAIHKKTSDDLRIKAVVGNAKLAAIPPHQGDMQQSIGIKNIGNNKAPAHDPTQVPSDINTQSENFDKAINTKQIPTNTLHEVREIHDIILPTANAEVSEKSGTLSKSIAGISSEPAVPLELKNEFLDENPCSLDDAILPDTPTLIARAQSITQAAANALSNTIMPTDIRLLTNDPMSSSSYVPSFGVTPTLVDGKGTRMYTFLHPAKYSRNHGNVLLDYCCPNLNGPMPAIDPTRIHSQIQTPVVELPAFIVLTTKVITRAELENSSSTVPAIIRKKAEKLRSSIAIHRNMSASPGTTINVVPPPSIPQQPALSPRPPPPRPPQLQQVIRPPHLAPAPHFSPAVNALTKYLPSTTTITAKIRPPLPETSLALTHPSPKSNQQSSAISVVAKGPPLLNEMQVNLLRSNLRRFDVVLKKLVQPFDKLNFTERHQIIDNLVMSGKFQPKDLDRSIVLMEEYSKQVNSLQTHQLTPLNTYNMSVATAPSPLTNLPSIQMPPLQPAPNLSPSVYKSATSQQQVHNTAIRQIQSSVKQHNTTVNTTSVKQRQVPIYDTERNIIGYQLQVITPTPSKASYSKPQMTTSTPGGMVSSALNVNSCSQRKAAKRPAQDSPRVFYTTQPLQTSTPKSNQTSLEYPVQQLATAKNTQAIAKSQKGSIVTTVRSAGPTSSGTETITTTTTATVKRVTRSRAAGSKIIIVSKTNSNEESILPDVSHQTEIKDEKDVEDFVG